MNMLRDMSSRLVSSGYEPGEARAVALLVLDVGFGVSQTDVYADKVRDFSAEETLRLENIMQRLEAGEPVQYCLGRADFDDMQLEVTPATLIPRPETQQLVSIVAAEAPERILDVGTGSGCIAIALQRRLPQARVEGWDVSSAALRVARRNAARYAPPVVFRRVDILSRKVLARSCRLAVVSNPPYVLESERPTMERRVLDHEPARALFVPDADPLLFYRKIGGLAARAGADVFFETNRMHAHDVAHLMRSLGYAHVVVYKDFADNDRFVVAKRV